MISENKTTPKKPELANQNISLVDAALQMSWKLAVAVLIPLIGGVKLDGYFNTFPYLTIAGSLLAIGGVVYVLHKVLVDFNQDVSKRPK